MIVETRDGRLRGVERDGVHAFLGVPFAAPPVGERRFRPPVPPEPWKGVRDALEFGPIAPQPPGFSAFIPPGTPQDEDCLTLNVWAPTGGSGGPANTTEGGDRPVMVWIHGGGFRQGGSRSPLYDGETLARSGDVVVVSVNYRLGALGFLSHPDLREGEGEPAGNWGLLDQIEALRWVRDNAAAFGGDPGNVTIFGESAGAASVSLLLASPSTQGLFQKAIAQSGSPTAPSLRSSARLAEHLAGVAGVGSVGALRDVPVDRLMAAQHEAEGPGNPMVFLPSVDGHLFVEPPIETLRGGGAAGIPTIVGTNRDEWKLWAPADPKSRTLDEAGLRRRLERRLKGDIDPVIDVFRDERQGRGEAVAPNDLWFAIESDCFFRVPAIRFTDALAAHEPRTHAYLFTWGSPAMKGWLGACHGLEIGFVFGNQGKGDMASFTGSGPEADRLSRWMMDAWVAFARTGDPSTPDLGSWPAYKPSERSTLVIGTDHTVEHAPMEPERRVIEERLPA
jgi:para-nitrobenzyl esterase